MQFVVCAANNEQAAGVFVNYFDMMVVKLLPVLCACVCGSRCRFQQQVSLVPRFMVIDMIDVRCCWGPHTITFFFVDDGTTSPSRRSAESHDVCS